MPDFRNVNWATPNRVDEESATATQDFMQSMQTKQKQNVAAKVAEQQRIQGIKDFIIKEKIKKALGGNQQRPYKVGKSDIQERGQTLAGEAEEKYPADIIQSEKSGAYGPRGVGARFHGAITPWATEKEKQAKEVGGQREEYVSEGLKPLLEQQIAQFSGQPYQAPAEGQGQDIEALIEEYQTTNDPQRLQELEDLLSQSGVDFE